MNLTIDTSKTADINQLMASPTGRRQGYCYFIFPYEHKNLIHIAQSNFASLSNYILADYYGLSNLEIDNATAFVFPNFYQQMITDSSNERVCRFFNVLVGQFKPSRILTQLYNERSDTYPTDIIPIPSVDEPIELKLRNLFSSFDYEDFDIDIAYYLTNALTNLIKENGKPVIRIITKLIVQHEINDNIICETLKAIGRLDDENTKSDRFELLMKLLRDDSAIIRDGAVAGLSFFDDKKALAQLYILLEKETMPILKENIRVAITDLETV